jgi:hypothetical protein
MYFRASANDAAPMSESELYPAIIGTYSKGDTRLFRINSGLAWQGTVIDHSPERLILAHPRPVRLAAEGMSDIIGWSAGALFTAIECKSKYGRVTDAQQCFLNIVKACGGRAGIARSVEDAGLILRAD